MLSKDKRIQQEKRKAKGTCLYATFFSKVLLVPWPLGFFWVSYVNSVKPLGFQIHTNWEKLKVFALLQS
jgi:hypothetical protein